MAITADKLLPGVESGGNVVLTVPTKISLPSAKIVPGSKEKGVLGVVNIVKGGDDAEDKEKSGQVSDKTKDDVAEIRATTKKIHVILKKSVKINLQKIKLQKKSKENLKRKKREDSMESKDGDDRLNKKGKIELPKIGFFERIKNFFKQILGGYLLIKLVDFLPQMLSFAKAIQLGKIFDFIVDFSIGLFDKLVSFIDIGYGVVDKVNGITEKLFGEDAADKLRSFEGLFVKFMNLAIIAAMVASGGSNPLGGGKGGRGGGTNSRGRFNRNGIRTDRVNGFNSRVGRNGTRLIDSGNNLNNQRMIRGGSTSNAAAARSQQDLGGRYQRRFGKRAAQQRFGQAFGKVGKNVAAKGARRIAGKIPIVGPLIDFGIRTLIFKEPVGKAAAAAVGMAAGQALGTFLGGAIGGIVGSVVPFVGNLLLGAAGSTIGGLIGGVIGDQIGVSLYNVLIGNEGEGIEAKAEGGVIGSEEEKKREKEAERERLRRARIFQFTPSRSESPAETNLRKEPDGRNIFQKIFGVVKKGGPLALISKVRKRLNKRNNSMLAKIMGLGVDLLSGKKVDRRIVADIAKNLTTFFDAALPAPMSALRQLLQKLSVGGMVVESPAVKNRRLNDIGRSIESSFNRDVSRVNSGVLNDIRETSSNTVRGPIRASGPDPNKPNTYNNRTGGSQLPTQAGLTLPGSSKLSALTGTSGSVKYGGKEQANLSISYSPFAKGSGAVITSGQGYRYNTNSNHKGYDIGAATDTPMYAYLDGEVVDANKTLGSADDGGYGYWMIWKDSKHNAYHFFGHLHRPIGLNVGDKFKAGALLANVGGSASGNLTKWLPHLHWEIAGSTNGLGVNGGSGTLDPGNWVNTHGAGQIKPKVASNSPTLQPVSYTAPYEEPSTTLLIVREEVPVVIAQPSSQNSRALVIPQQHRTPAVQV
jgi:murein DD-endopeptidase MepM/ murein hydrolase activator NlpD